MGTGRCACCCCFPEGTCCDSWALTFGKQSIFYNFWKEWWKLNRYTQHDCLYTHHPFAGQHRCTRAPQLTRMAESPCGSTCARVRLLHCRLLKNKGPEVPCRYKMKSTFAMLLTLQAHKHFVHHAWCERMVCITTPVCIPQPCARGRLWCVVDICAVYRLRKNEYFVWIYIISRYEYCCWIHCMEMCAASIVYRGWEDSSTAV